MGGGGEGPYPTSARTSGDQWPVRIVGAEQPSDLALQLRKSRRSFPAQPPASVFGLDTQAALRSENLLSTRVETDTSID